MTFICSSVQYRYFYWVLCFLNRPIIAIYYFVVILMIINPQTYFFLFLYVSRIVCVSQNISCACSDDVLVAHITLRGEGSILPEYTCYVKQCHYNQTTALILLHTCSMFRIDLKLNISTILFWAFILHHLIRRNMCGFYFTLQILMRYFYAPIH